MDNKMKLGIALAAAFGLPTLAIAGPEAMITESLASNGGDWCEWYSNKPGQLKIEENPYLQSFRVSGRFHFQGAVTDGSDVNGNDFSTNQADVRRFRVQTDIGFLKFFSVRTSLNLAGDRRRSGGELDWGYQDFDEAYITFDIKKAFNVDTFDKLSVKYGRHKYEMTEEVHMSSNAIHTIERSAIANKLFGAFSRPTGVTMNAVMGKWDTTIGVFSGVEGDEFVAGWNAGRVYYLSTEYTQNDTLRYILDFAQNDQEGTDDFLGFERATALNMVYDDGTYGFLGTAVIGQNNEGGARGGSFYGFVAMPWYWIIPDKLQAVFQYQYSGASEAEGIRTTSRYFRADHGGIIDVNSGRGDSLHTAYVGLNYKFCGNNAKVMSGIEYTNLETPSGTADGLTYSMAFRTTF